MTLVLEESALGRKVETWTTREDLGDVGMDMKEMLNGVREQVTRMLSRAVERKKMVRFQFLVECEYSKDGEVCKLNFKTKSYVLTEGDDITAEIEKGFNKLLIEKGECEVKGSSHCFERIISFKLKVYK